MWLIYIRFADSLANDPALVVFSLQGSVALRQQTRTDHL